MEESTVTHEGGTLVITVQGTDTLPAGSMVTITVHIGGEEKPEPAPQPQPTPQRRYMNRREG